MHRNIDPIASIVSSIYPLAMCSAYITAPSAKILIEVSDRDFTPHMISMERTVQPSNIGHK